MVILHIQHNAVDYEKWKSLFDGDPADRRGSGVRRFRITRGVADPSFVTIALDLDDLAAAEAMLAKLRTVWEGPAAASISNVSAWIASLEEDVTL